MSFTRTRSAAFTADPAARASSSALTLWAGRVMYWLAVAFLTMDAVMKVLRVPAAVEGTTQLGYASYLIAPLGAIEVILLVLYLVPRTAILGAVLAVAEATLHRIARRASLFKPGDAAEAKPSSPSRPEP